MKVESHAPTSKPFLDACNSEVSDCLHFFYFGNSQSQGRVKVQLVFLSSCIFTNMPLSPSLSLRELDPKVLTTQYLERNSNLFLSILRVIFKGIQTQLIPHILVSLLQTLSARRNPKTGSPL